MRIWNPNLVMYDAGGFASDRRLVGETTTRFILRALGKLGYSAITLGEPDLKHSMELYDIDGPPRIVMSNVFRPEDGRLVPAAHRYVIDEVAGVRIGVFALLTPVLPDTVWRALEGWEVRDPELAARESIEYLESHDVDVIVLLSQLDRDRADSLLVAFPEIDVAILGHESTALSRADDGVKAVTLRTMPRGRSVASAELVVAPDGSIPFVNEHVHEITSAILPQKEMATLVAEADAEIKRLEDEVTRARLEEAAAHSEANHYVGSTECARCHQVEHENWLGSPHASAFETLEALGMQRSTECLRCHTVGFGDASGFTHAADAPDLAGVQCESCHGMGSRHFDPLTAENTEAMCVRCHDRTNSPDFDLSSYLSKIRHW